MSTISLGGAHYQLSYRPRKPSVGGPARGVIFIRAEWGRPPAGRRLCRAARPMPPKQQGGRAALTFRMNLDLSGKRAIVCGASSGIGRACAIELAALGAAVTVIARNETKLAILTRELPLTASVSQLGGHEALCCDLSQPGEVSRIIQHWLTSDIASRTGGAHVLVNNTGGPAPGRAIDTTLDAFRAGLDSLLLSPQVLVQALVPGMKAAGFGRIINITSTSVKQPIANLAVSNAIRAATAAWAKTLSQELASLGITVNNILPGFTDTERLAEIFEMRARKAAGGPPTAEQLDKARADTIAGIPAGRLGHAGEIAAAVAFLASPAAAYINGINLPVDGGRLGSL